MMNSQTKGKARSHGTGKRAGGAEAGNRTASYSARQHNTGTITRQEGQIEKVLLHGEHSAISGKDLLRICGFSTIRQLRSAVSAERMRGALIISSSDGGYFLPSEDPTEARQELLNFVSVNQSRAFTLLRTLRTARKALRNCEGQEQINEEQ